MIGESDTRPWGSWTILDEGESFKVKRIDVLPHSRLSYQTHEHRAEHWVVVRGTCTYVLDGLTKSIGPGECVEVAVQQAHRIINETDEPLSIIEIQRGAYCGEDDITRLEDDFGRV